MKNGLKGAVLAALALGASVVQADVALTLTGRADHGAAGRLGPLATAAALAPERYAAPTSGFLAQAEAEYSLRAPLGLSLHVNARLAQERLTGQRARDDSRINELHASIDLNQWQIAAGAKVLSWDVGHGWRPNDLVQQETRRTQFAQTPKGRPLLMLEHFGTDAATTLVWVNPQGLNDPPERQRRAQESAWAARHYQHVGALDLHLFARWGRHTGPSLGAAAAWVAGETWSLHTSWRALRRHDRWARQTSSAQLLESPWRLTTGGAATQALVGLQWTGGPRLSVLLEAWYDGSAPSDTFWQEWHSHADTLAGRDSHPISGAAAAGPWAWQAAALDNANLRRDNLFARLSWQPPGDWTLSIDVLHMPADRGRILSLGAQWIGEHWRLNTNWRRYDGPSQALVRQLPLRHNLMLAVTRSF